MKKEMSVLLSGLGYYKLSEQRRKTLSYVLGASLVLHLLAGAIFGGWIIIKSFQEEETVFIAPPPLKTYQPRQLEHQVKVQKRQRSSSRPTVRPRILAQKPSNFALPVIENPKVVNTTFQPNFKAVTGVGLGLGLGTGYGSGGFGTGVSQFNFFGIQGRGDKIAILVDVSVSMLSPEAGGEKGFEKVKMRLGQVIDALNEQALFNVIAFAEEASTLMPKMAIANQDNKRKAKDFLAPFNRGSNMGLTSGNVRPSRLGIPAQGGETRLDLALTAAFEQGADTILVFTDGLPKVIKPNPNISAMMERHRLAMDEWQKQYGDAARKHREAVGQLPTREVEEKKPIERDGVVIGWQTVKRRVPVNAPQTGFPSAPKAPQSTIFWTIDDFVEHFNILNAELYEKKGRRRPVVHIIGYAIDDEGSRFLRLFARAFDGKYRRVGRSM